MNKPGWQTTEWWTTTISQVLAVLTVFGILAPTEAHTLEGALTKIVAAAFLLATNAWTVVHSIKGRVTLKTLRAVSSDPPQRSVGITLPLVAVLLLLPAGSARAQSVSACLPWRAQVERRLQQLEQQARPAAPQ